MIEYRILYISAFCINLFLFAASIIYWRTLKTYPGVGLWIISNGIMAIINLTIMAQGAVDVAFLLFIGNCITVLVGVIRLEAFNRFCNRHARSWLYLPVILLIFILLFLSTFIWKNVLFRTAIMTVVLVFVLFRIIRVSFLPGSGIAPSISRLIAFICLVYTGSIVYRAADWFLFPSHHGLLTPSIANIQFSIVSTLLEITFTAIFLVLNSQRLMKELISLQKRLEELASTDPLTGLLNRRVIFEFGEVEFERARRYQHGLSIILFDLDHFKQINDTFGHAAGDTVLKAVADACLEDVRQSEILGRLGGDEFVIILPETEIGGANVTAERLRQKIKSITLTYAETEIQTTISIGVAELSDRETKFDDLLHTADLALYREKKSDSHATNQTQVNPLAVGFENGISF